MVDLLVIGGLGVDPAGDLVRAALTRAGVPVVLADDPAGTRRSVNLVDPGGRRMSLYDPRGWRGAPQFPPTELAEVVRNARHVHLSIMDWTVPLLPTVQAALPAGVTLSTDLHDWDGANPCHLRFAEVADLILVSGVRLADRAAPLARGLAPRTVVVTRADGAELYPGDRTAVPVPPAPTTAWSTRQACYPPTDTPPTDATAPPRG